MTLDASRDLKIGIVFDDDPSRDGGIQQYCRTLGAALKANGHSVQLLCGGIERDTLVGPLRAHGLARNVPVVFNGNRFTMPIAPRLSKIHRVLDSEKFDVLHVQMPYSPLLAGRIIDAAPRSTAIVGTFHVVAEQQTAILGARVLATLTASSLKRFHHVMCVSETAQRFAAATFGVEASTIVPNMIDLGDDQAVCTLPDSVCHGAPLIASVGALVPRKGYHDLLRAFAALERKLPDARLTIGGDGPLKASLERAAIRLGIADKVRLIGRVTDAQRTALFMSADIACFPATRGESFGVVLLEAMAAGAGATIGGPNPGHREVLGEPAAIIPSHDPARASDFLHRLWSEPGLRTMLRTGQSQRIREFDSRIVVARVLSIYKSALASARLESSPDCTAAPAPYLSRA